MQAGVILLLQLASAAGTFASVAVTARLSSLTSTWMGALTADGAPRLVLTVRLTTGASLMPGVI